VRVRSIAAGAGTGKTTELTRVIRESILNGECRPHAIIGTTFTIKAAGELVERVRQEFFKSRRLDLAERLAESLLGTVDGVCLRLLTRFAFEAGISPDIQISPRRSPKPSGAVPLKTRVHLKRWKRSGCSVYDSAKEMAKN
jgi:superfamily I DNA/RNA helicase